MSLQEIESTIDMDLDGDGAYHEPTPDEVAAMYDDREAADAPDETSEESGGTAADEKPQKGDEVDAALEDLRDRAKALGISKEWVDEVGKDIADRHIVGVERQVANIIRNVAAKIQEANKAKETPAAAAKGEAEAASDDDDDLELPDLDDYDPAVAKLLKGMVGEVKRLRKEVATQKQAPAKPSPQQSATADQNAALEEFDSLIEKLGPEWEDVFGKGPTLDMLNDPKAKDFLEARKAMLMDSAGQETMAAATDRRAPKMETLFNRSLSGLHPEKLQELSARRTEKAIKERDKLIQSPPTSRKMAPKRGAAAADARLEAAYREMGLHPGADDEEPEEI